MQFINQILRFRLLILSGLFLMAISFMLSACNQKQTDSSATGTSAPMPQKLPKIWAAPDTAILGNSDSEQLIKYGKKTLGKQL
jgi:hypothetical protein